MTEPDMREIANLIGRAIRNESGTDTTAITEQVTGLVTRHPAYPRG
jgi:glycine/serine hydroxymethyltransferase